MRLRSSTRRLAAIAAAFSLAVTGAVTSLSPTLASAAEGENVALASAGAAVTASGNEVSDGRWSYQMATDGDTSTRWSSNHADDAWLQVELAEPTVISHVNVLWEAACAARYKIQVSNDGTDWTDATSEIVPTCPTAPNFSVDRQELNDATATQEWDFVRMQALDRTPIGGRKWGVSLFEFQVWNGDEPAPPAPPATDLVPLPMQLSEDEGDPFVLDAATRIVAAGDAADVAEVVAQELRAATGFELPIVASGDTNVIKFVLDPAYDSLFEPASWLEANPDGSYPEGYDLVTTADSAAITSVANHGLWNGAQTLRQLFPPMIYSETPVYRAWSAPAVTIKDAPRYVHRGTQIDVARSFIEVDELKAILDTLSSVKISRVHLHLADDQGWRIEITNEGRAEGDEIDYTRLHRIGGNLSMAETEPGKHFGSKQEIGRNGYYTQEQYKDIVAYAAERHITIVPEIDVPGHTGAMLHAIPELNTDATRPFKTVYGNTVEQNNGNVGESTLDLRNPHTWVALRHIFGQLAEMTPGPYIHVGGDETHSTPHADFQAFVRQVIPIVRDLKKSAIGWNEFADAGLSEGDVVQYWVGGTQRTYDAIQAGAKVVTSMSNRAYLDMKYGNGLTPIGLTWAGQGDVDHYYNWNPLNVVRPPQEGMPLVKESDIIGMEGPMWSETIRRGTQNEFMMFPRAFSHAEIGWTPQDMRDYSEFAKRLEPMGARLLAQGTNFYDTPKITWDTDVAGINADAAPATAAHIDVATLAAPGTIVSEDGLSVSVDNVNDADGTSSSELTEPLTATIDFGDGNEVPATFTAIQERTNLHAGSRYLIGAEHTYAAAGSNEATVTFSDGRVVTGVVAVTEGYEAPVAWSPDVCTAPAVLLQNATIQDNSRVVADLSGFTPNSLATIQLSQAPIEVADSDDTKFEIPSIQGRYWISEDGTAHLTMPIVYRTLAGKYLLRVTDVDGRFFEQVITVDSPVVPLTGEPITPAAVTATSEALNETAPDGRAAAIIDGARNTFWHSQWSSPAPGFPHTIEIDLGAVEDLDWMTWVPRQNSNNGQVSNFKISFSEDNSTWTEPEAMTLPVGRTATDFDLDQSARYVRIVITENHGTADEFATIGELEFRKVASEDTPVADPTPAVWEAPASCGPDTAGPAVLDIQDVAIVLGEAVSVPVAAEDDSLPLSYSATGLPAGVTIDEETGIISGTPTAAGTYAVTVTATDAEGNSTSVSFSIDVTAPVADTEGPVITEVGDVEAEVDAALTIQIRATDDSLPLTFAAEGLPAGLAIDRTTGLISGTPTEAGTFPVVVTVTDGEGNKSTVSFTITVEGEEQPPADTTNPVVQPVGNHTAEVGEAVTVPVKATDESALTYAATGLPAGLSIDSATGVISGTPTKPGTSQVTVTVTDAEGNVTSVTFSITVKAKATEPVTPPAGKYPRTAPYTLEGEHTVGERQWRTTCEPYSQTERCRAEIWASVVKRSGNVYTIERGWAFNNLTYLPYMEREQWKNNPLGGFGEYGYDRPFTGTDGQQWRVECDSTASGRNGCRAYRMTTVYFADAKAGGGYTFGQRNEWVFNNIVLFGNYSR